MNLRIWFARPESVKVLARIHFAIIGVVALLAAWWGVQFALFSMRASAASATAKQHVATIGTARKTIADAKRLTKPEPASGLKAVDAFQAMLQKKSGEYKCEVAEFQAASEVSPYLSKFTKTTDKTGWQQVAVRVTLYGALPEVLGTLSAIGAADIPFEFDSVNITRKQVDGNGATQVSAAIELRILMQESKP